MFCYKFSVHSHKLSEVKQHLTSMHPINYADEDEGRTNNHISISDDDEEHQIELISAYRLRGLRCEIRIVKVYSVWISVMDIRDGTEMR